MLLLLLLDVVVTLEGDRGWIYLGLAALTLAVTLVTALTLLRRGCWAAPTPASSISAATTALDIVDARPSVTALSSIDDYDE